MDMETIKRLYKKFRRHSSSSPVDNESNKQYAKLSEGTAELESVNIDKLQRELDESVGLYASLVEESKSIKNQRDAYIDFSKKALELVRRNQFIAKALLDLLTKYKGSVDKNNTELRKIYGMG